MWKGELPFATLDFLPQPDQQPCPALRVILDDQLRACLRFHSNGRHAFEQLHSANVGGTLPTCTSGIDVPPAPASLQRRTQMPTAFSPWLVKLTQQCSVIS